MTHQCSTSEPTRVKLSVCKSEELGDTKSVLVLLSIGRRGNIVKRVLEVAVEVISNCFTITSRWKTLPTYVLI